ncbi:MAG TPA: type II toxin-antitoxin system VapC family toxin [Candidatus Saccharimonadales bacterium]|nr:type II toxin-antitoxin system VapC family toxin [Candidatus Saccharimonadales bacterium]
MKSYLIETSVIIDYLKGKEQATSVVDSLEGELTSSYICLAELYEGIYRVTNKAVLEKAVQTYFSSLTTIYGVDALVAKTFGKLRAELKKKGMIIEDLDLFLAATAVAYDLEIVTFNKKHFAHVEALKIHQYN